MPLPKRNESETESEFLDRCMSDPIMVKEYPDSKQRVAICHSIIEEDKSANNIKTEYKYFDFITDETKEDDEYYHIKGYGAATGNRDKGNDIIVQGGYKSTFEYVKNGGKIKAYWQHNRNEPVGIWDDILEDVKGLFVAGRLPKTDSFVRDRVVPQIKLGTLGLSIGYKALKKEIKNGIRYLKDILIDEISFVGYPMNDEAIITDFKSVDIEALEFMDARTMEMLFRNGFKCSRKTSELLVNLVKSHYQRDPDNSQGDPAIINDIDKVFLDSYRRSIKSITQKYNK